MGNGISGNISNLNGISGGTSAKGNLRGGVSAPTTGTKDYNQLKNKPKIEGHELIGDQTFRELGLNSITPQTIDEIIYGG